MSDMSEDFAASYTPEEKNYLDTKGGEISPKEPPPVENEVEDDVSTDDVHASDDTKDRSENEQPEQKERRGRVPLRQFRQEEERRKSAEREAQTLREQAARFDERLKMIYAAQQQNEQPKDEAPDPSQDPIGAIQWQQRQIEAQRQAYEQQQRTQQEQAVISQIDNGYRRAFHEFSAETPDAPLAYQHFTNALGKYFETLGVPEAQIDALVVQEERKLAYQAAQRGQNPAKIVYEMARQFGYAPAPQETQDREAIEKAEKDIDRRQKAAAASKSISNASGSRGGRAPSAQELISMSDEEFAEMRSKMSDREFRRIAGG